MASDQESFDDFGEGTEGLGLQLGAVSEIVSVFSGELEKFGKAVSDVDVSVSSVTSSLSGSLRRSFDGLVFDGLKVSDAMRNVGQSLIRATYSAATKPITQGLSSYLAEGLAGVAAFGNGASFSQGRVRPFAKGGVVTGPSVFPMRRGTGLMGEAGPEAIMPLTRGADGRLGVQAAGGGQRPVQVVMNISTPDVAGFQRSQSQISASVSRVLAQGQRNR